MSGLFAIEDLDNLFPVEVKASMMASGQSSNEHQNPMQSNLQMQQQQQQQQYLQQQQQQKLKHSGSDHQLRNNSVMLSGIPQNMDLSNSSSSSSSMPLQNSFSQSQHMNHATGGFQHMISGFEHLHQSPGLSINPQQLHNRPSNQQSQAVLNQNNSHAALLKSYPLTTAAPLNVFSSMGMAHHESASLLHPALHHANPNSSAITQLLASNSNNSAQESAHFSSLFGSDAFHAHLLSSVAPSSSSFMTALSQNKNVSPPKNQPPPQRTLSGSQSDSNPQNSQENTTRVHPQQHSSQRQGHQQSSPSKQNHSIIIRHPSVSPALAPNPLLGSNQMDSVTSDVEDYTLDISDALSVGGESCISSVYSDFDSIGQSSIPWQHQQQLKQGSSNPNTNNPRDCPFGAKNVVDCRRRKVVQACTACRKAHVSCDDVRPCRRCVKRGMADQCVDAPRKMDALPKPCSVCPVRSLPRPDPKLLAPQDAMKVTKRRRTVSPARKQQQNPTGHPTLTLAPSPSYTSVAESPHSTQLSPSVSPCISPSVPFGMVHSPISQVSPFSPQTELVPPTFTLERSSTPNSDPSRQHNFSVTLTPSDFEKTGSHSSSLSHPATTLPIVLVTPAGGNSPPNIKRKGSQDSLDLFNNNGLHLRHSHGLTTERRLSAPPFPHAHNDISDEGRLSLPLGTQCESPGPFLASASNDSPHEDSLFAIEPLQEKLQQDGVAQPIIKHVIDLVRQVRTLSDIATLPSSSFNIAECSQVVDQVVSGTPTVVFSPTGMIYTCNLSFAQHILTSDMASLVKGKGCVFSYMDIPSVLGILNAVLQRMKGSQKAALSRSSNGVEIPSNADGSSRRGDSNSQKNVSAPVPRQSLVVRCRFSQYVSRTRRFGQVSSSPTKIMVSPTSPSLNMNDSFSQRNALHVDMTDTYDVSTSPSQPPSATSAGSGQRGNSLSPTVTLESHSGNDVPVSPIQLPPLEALCTVSTLIDSHDRHLWIVMQCIPLV